MKINPLGVLCAVAFYLITVDGCFAREVLFYKASRDYDSEGQLGKVYRQELEARMFKHSTWRQRLYRKPYEPDINETLEVYSKADGSHWLSCRRATPSLSGVIFARIWLGAQFDLKKKLNAVRITGQEVVLPANVSKEIELLWRAMLPGLPKDPDPEVRVIVPHAPIIIAFSRESGSVKTGTIAMAAYNTPAYRAFMGIVGDLINACDRGAKFDDPIFKRLPDKLQRLRARL